MSRPPARSVLRTLVAVAACLAILAVIQRGQDNDPSAASTGVSTSFSGRAFAAGAGGGPPVMRLRGLRRGQATSGTVTVRNAGRGPRYFWLSAGRVSERLGVGGGRLSSAVALTVMEVTDIASPAVVYRGPVAQLGARPLGFLAPGARRSFSFVAERPAGAGPPASPAADPYRGAGATVAWTWRSIAGRPVPDTPPPPRARDGSAPRLTFSVPRRQRLLERRSLTAQMRCSEDCAARARATMRSGGRSWTLPVRRSGPGLQLRHELSVRFSRRQAAALRAAMLGGRATKVRVAVEAFDRSGNRRRDGHTITLRPLR